MGAIFFSVLFFCAASAHFWLHMDGFASFAHLFPFPLDVGSEYEHDSTIAEFQGRELDEGGVRGLDFSKVMPAELKIASDCRAVTLVYFWKLRQEHHDFGLVYGASVQKQRVDPHWAMIVRLDTEEYLVDPFLKCAVRFTDLACKDDTYFAAAVLKGMNYQYCFARCPPDRHDFLLSSLRFAAVEKALAFFPAMFGTCGLWRFPNPSSMASSFNAHLGELSRLLDSPTTGRITMEFSMNETVIGAELQDFLLEFCQPKSKSQLEKKQREQAKIVTAMLDFDFDEMIKGSQYSYYAMIMCLNKK